MPLDLNTALNSYGFVGQLANAIPDLKTILDKAIREQWVPEQFTRHVMDSKWWKSNAESVRQIVRLQATDPATYAQNLKNATQKVTLMSREMGLADRGDFQAVGLHMLVSNYDDEQIRSWLGTNSKLAGAGTNIRSGNAAQLSAQLTEMVSSYGVPTTQDTIDRQTKAILAGTNSLEGFESVARARAKATYPHLAGQIDAGMTVRDIADPYIATYAQTLELPETGVKLTDPAIQKALQAKAADGATFTNKPMYQFQRELKDDPRWTKTKNANDEADAFLSKIGKSWGFIS